MAWCHRWCHAFTHPRGQRDFPVCAFTPLSVVPELPCRRRQWANHAFCHMDRRSGIRFPLVIPQQLQNLPSLFLACGVEVWICSEEGQGLRIAVECGSCTVFFSLLLPWFGEQRPWTWADGVFAGVLNEPAVVCFSLKTLKNGIPGVAVFSCPALS